jgi:hypothetical protein
VTVNGLPVAGLDAMGRFFEPVVIHPGINTYTFTAIDAAGQQVSAALEILGTELQPSDIDFSRYSDISGSFSGAYFRTSFNEQAKLLHVDLATRNDGQFATDVPLLVGVKNISDPSVRVVGFDGVMPDGTPYYDYSEFVVDGRLKPGELTESPTVLFHNPNRVQFNYELVFYAKLNEAPYFTSVPRLEALAGRDYTYDADAVDPDNDPLTYSLLLSPSGMSIDGQSGLITWTPTQQQIGQHDVTVEVSDGRGGFAEQRYIVTATVTPPNRPPIITSTPVTKAYVSQQVVSAEGMIDFDDLPGVFYAPGTIVPPESQLTTQYLNSHGVTFRSLGSVTHVAVVDLDSFVFGHASLTSPNGISGVSGSNRIDYATPIEIQFFSPIDTNIAATTTYVSMVTDTFGEGRIVRLEAYDIHGRLIDTESIRDNGGTELRVDASGIHFVRIFGNGTAGLDDLRFGPLSVNVLPTYAYPVFAVDPDDDTLSYQLLESPQGMEIASTTGLIRWSPTADQIGDHTVIVEVSDGRGGIATQEFVICVHPDPSNNPPVIISEPINWGFVGQEYIYQAIAIDPDGDELSFELVEPPAGMTINSETGLLNWIIPDSSDENVSVSLTVSDGRGGFANQEVMLTVSADLPGVIRGTKIHDLDGDGQRNFTPDLDTVLEPSPVLVVAPEFADHYTAYSLGVVPAVPVNYGGVTFAPWDPNLLLIGGRANTAAGAIYGIQLKRGSDGYIVGFDGEAEKLFDAPYNDGGIVFHPSGVLFTSRWPVNQLGQMLPGSTAPDKVIDLAPFGVASSHAALLIPEEGYPGYGTIKLVSWSGGQWYQAELEPDGFGTFDLVNLVHMPEARLTTGPEGLAYVPRGSTLFEEDHIIVAEYSANAVSAYRVTEAGDPIPASRRVMMSGLAGAEGAVIDPLTGDFLFSTFRQSHQVAIIRGFQAPNPAEPGIEDWVIYLDQNGNGIRDPWEPYTRTDSNGDYEFSNLAPGSYIVREEIPPGWRQTFPLVSTQTDSHLVELSSGQIVAGINFLNEKIDLVKSGDVRFISEPPLTASATSITIYKVTAVSDNNFDLAYALVSSPSGMTVHPTLGTVVWRPTVEQIGQHQVVLRVTDGRGGVDLQSFTITVTAPNTAPVFTSSPSLQAGTAQTWRYPVRWQDAENDEVTLSVASGPTGMVYDPDDHAFQWTTTAGDVGEHPVTLRVTDAHGAFSEQSFTLSVTNNFVNRAPVFNSSPRTHLQAGRTFRYPVDVSDPDGDRVTLILVEAPEGMSLDENQTLIWQTPATLAGTTADVLLRATDGRGGITDQEFSIRLTTEMTNSAPLITSQPRLSAVVNQPYTYDLAAFDADGDAIRWQLLQAPLGMSLDPDTGTLRWTPRPDQLGRQMVVIEAWDAFNVAAVQRFEIEVVCFNRNPAILSVPPTRALVDSGYLYPVRAIDPDGDSLRFELENAPAGMTIDAGTGLIRWRPTNAQIGSHDIRIIARDPAGATGRQNYTVVVALGTDLVEPNDPDGPTLNNRSPLITSTPVFTAVADELYRYDVIAIDPDGDQLTYSVESDAPNLSIDPATGRISWTPAAGQVGQYTVTVQAIDERGASGFQSYVLAVRANQPPQIVSQPRLTATPESTYRYTVRATDPDNDPITYRLVSGPDGMTINSTTGAILWTPALEASGQVDVTVSASDDRGASDSQSFAITITPDTEAPRVTLVSSTNLVNVGHEVTYFVQATDNVGVEQLRLFIDGEAVALGPDGRLRITMPRPGLIDVEAVATDRAGNEGRATLTVRVLDPNDTRVPSVTIISPEMDATLNYLTNIVGTVSVSEGQQLEYWSVEFAPTSLVDVDQFGQPNPAFREIGRGTTPVDSQVLATFDPTMLLNGGYIIRLSAFNTNGQGWVAGIRVSVEGHAKIGNFRLEFTDLSIPLAGIPITVNRIYDTLQTPFETDFGHGWTMSLGDPQIFETVPAGQSFVPGSTKVFLTNPEGRRVGFTYDEELIGGNLLAGGTVTGRIVIAFLAEL